MAGIAGIISKEGKRTKKQKVNSMLEKIRHRGRNSKILVSSNNAEYGIVSHDDLKEKVGNQKTFFDGKIFNIDKLMKKYDEKDQVYNFNKLSALFKDVGPDIFSELEGSYALVSSNNEDTYIARDTIGKKPLYYALDSDNKSLFFASEIKALASITENIKEMPPGSLLKNTETPKKINLIKKENNGFFNEKDITATEKKLDEIFLRSVKERMPAGSDEIGVWLSGGIDSSIVAAMVNKFSKNVYTFSVGFEGCSDLKSSKIVADHIGSKHFEHFLSIDELFNMIPKVIYYLESFDAPLVRSSLGNMIVSKISSKTDFVFSGEGGDEVFGGYNYFLDFNTSDKIQEELVLAINSLHNTALQRVDRLANAYGVNVRLPMLDEELIDFALKIPTGSKIRKEKNLTKYILRKLASKYLPDNIAWRAKEKFWEGSGITTKLTEKIEALVTDEEFASKRQISKDFQLRNKEELYYYNIFRRYYPNVDVSSTLSFTKDFVC